MVKKYIGGRAGYAKVSGSTVFCWLLLGLVVIMLFSSHLASLNKYYLIVSDGNGHVFLTLPLKRDEEFSLSYLHSVHRTPVKDVFRLTSSGELLLVATEFSSLGVGTPFLPEEGTLTEVNGKLLLQGIHRFFPELQLRPLALTEHKLLYRQSVYSLSDYIKNDSLIILRVHQGKSAKPANAVN